MEAVILKKSVMSIDWEGTRYDNIKKYGYTQYLVVVHDKKYVTSEKAELLTLTKKNQNERKYRELHSDIPSCRPNIG